MKITMNIDRRDAWPDQAMSGFPIGSCYMDLSGRPCKALWLPRLGPVVLGSYLERKRERPYGKRARR